MFSFSFRLVSCRSPFSNLPKILATARNIVGREIQVTLEMKSTQSDSVHRPDKKVV